MHRKFELAAELLKYAESKRYSKEEIKGAIALIHNEMNPDFLRMPMPPIKPFSAKF